MPPRPAALPKGPWLTERELADLIGGGFTVDGVQLWRKQGRGPDYFKSPGRAGIVRYPEQWVIEWMESHRVRMSA